MSESEPVLCYVSGQCAYFTTCELSKQWGDDWNDAPYEHNAGSPYEWRSGSGADPYRIVRLYFDDVPYDQPCDGCCNSLYSVEAINAGRVPWLAYPHWREDASKDRHIFAGETLSEFVRKVREAGGKVYTEHSP